MSQGNLGNSESLANLAYSDNTLSQSQSTNVSKEITEVTPHISLNTSDDDDLLVNTRTLPESTQMRSIWQSALNICKLSDPDRQGWVSKDVFINALEKSDTKDRLSEEERFSLANKFAINTHNVDYRNCFRMYLHQLAGFTIISGNNNTNFNGYIHSVSRDKKPHHPWEFEYKRHESSYNPYIPMSNGKGKLTVLDYIRARSDSHQISGKYGGKQNMEEMAILMTKYEAKVLGICKKYALSVPFIELKYLKHDLRKCEGRAICTGIISPLSFQSTLTQYFKSVSASEIGTLLRVFRVSETKKDVNYQAFMHVCWVVRESESV